MTLLLYRKDLSAELHDTRIYPLPILDRTKEYLAVRQRTQIKNLPAPSQNRVPIANP